MVRKLQSQPKAEANNLTLNKTVKESITQSERKKNLGEDMVIAVKMLKFSAKDIDMASITNRQQCNDIQMECKTTMYVQAD